MNLTYRGVSYQPSENKIQINKTTSFAKYRGHYYQLTCAVYDTHNCDHYWDRYLVYRGVKHNATSSDNSTELKTSFV